LKIIQKINLFFARLNSMKTKKLHKDVVNITTLGCSKNMVDSEVLSGQLLANGIEVKHESEKPDYNISIINTCGLY
jgi:ribosomal protein S12 methylthiotransferase